VCRQALTPLNQAGTWSWFARRWLGLPFYCIFYLLLATQGHSFVWVLEQSFLSTNGYKKWGLVVKLYQCNPKCIYLQKQDKIEDSVGSKLYKS